jgi:hypothetical protein
LIPQSSLPNGNPASPQSGVSALMGSQIRRGFRVRRRAVHPARLYADENILRIHRNHALTIRRIGMIGHRFGHAERPASASHLEKSQTLPSSWKRDGRAFQGSCRESSADTPRRGFCFSAGGEQPAFQSVPAALPLPPFCCYGMPRTAVTKSANVLGRQETCVTSTPCCESAISMPR